jgi:leader peptidase (prepilin peptidase)/N-methyltransferase
VNVSDSLLLTLADLWLILMGLAVGSFLNVVIARVPEGQSIVRPRSRCPKCGHALPWYENIPVVSWVALRGRCSACKVPISWQYPLVELCTAILFWACRWRFGWTFELVPAVLLVALLIPLSVIDLKHWILPFELTRPGVAMGVLTAIPLGWPRAQAAILGALLGFFGFWLLEWIGRRVFGQEALGGGDKWLLALLGAFLTYRSLLGVIFFASLQGSIVGLLLKSLTGRAGPAPTPDPTPDPQEDDWTPGPSNIPFGPWLSLAGLELLFLGPALREAVPGILGTFLSGS